jgi:hypothetical protein
VNRTPVHVNPRYGRWDVQRQAVVPASNDMVAGSTGGQPATLECGQGAQGQG